MVVRTVVGFVLIALLIVVLYFSPLWVIPVVITAISVLSMHEMLYSTGFVRDKRLIACSMAFSAAAPFLVYFGLPGSAGVSLYLFALFLIALSDMKNVSFEKIGMCFLAGVLVPSMLAPLFRILCLKNGRYLILIPFIAAYVTDTFAFFTGMGIGKTKLAPRISPHKTVEGMIGGLAGAVLAMLFYGKVLESFFGLQVSYPLVLLFAVAGSFASVFGDLSMSYVKRRAGIKDFGTLLPGHGGVLDRIDSLLFAAPAVEMLLTLFPGIIK